MDCSPLIPVKYRLRFVHSSASSSKLLAGWDLLRLAVVASDRLFPLTVDDVFAGSLGVCAPSPLNPKRLTASFSSTTRFQQSV
ncbi:hypothetical protein CONPUDRAFT_81285 [Coniophora puteana RWD-64-598 SS2]|uniref:Uncharacterized protein n=1 Tax=Coniophora puteana (strain RWD-64-598) TaxID=741705 RepID=A0A5M3MWC3_CONPW|nr:uncharacterized protein CONPUDRAFT_81285 [Coniophora puteana RWD-64-598 SS2]EIW83287.1 hypothetical protein CONPUDRAFT_81285 [Coniophora puteana RWD-64-598 SS2]